MKLKLTVLTLLVVGLVIGATSANAAFVVAANKDVAGRTVAAGDSVVVGAFSVTTAAALTMDTMTITGSGVNLAAANIANVAIYEDININGAMDPGVDEIVFTLDRTSATSAIEIEDWAGNAACVCNVTDVEFAAGEKRYYIVVVTLKTTESAEGAMDGKVMISKLKVSDTTPADSNEITPANASTVAIIANKLTWKNPKAAPTFTWLTATTVEMLQAATDGNTLIAAVDAYGNLDSGFGEIVKLSSVSMLDGSALGTLTATSGGGVDMVGGAGVAMVGGVLINDVTTAATANGIQALSVAQAGTNAITLVATSQGASALVGTTTVTIGAAYPAISGSGLATNRGIEIYDTNLNGKIDHVAIFFNVPIKSDAATFQPIDEAGANLTPATAFGVAGYSVTGVPLVCADNGGYGIRNGGEYAVTIQVTEGSAYDTDATPQVTYDPPVLGKLDDALVAAGLVPAVSASAATEVDKARPVIVMSKTLDTGNGGTAYNGKIDGVQVNFSEPVDGVSIQAAKAAPTTAAFSLDPNNQKSTPTVLTFSTASTNVGNENFVFIVTEGAFRTTDELPVLLYDQGGSYKVVDNARDVNGVPQRNELIVDKSKTVSGSAITNVKDGVPAVVLNVTTNDTGTANGKLDTFTVEFTEEVGIKPAGVTFVSAVSTFGTYTATKATAVTGKIINYTVTEKSVYDTEAVPTFAYDPDVTNSRLFDFGGNELVKYGTGGQAQINSTLDAAAPVIVKVISRDLRGDTTYAGGSAFDNTNPDGRLDAVEVEFSEKVTTTNYGSSATAANFKKALGQLTIKHEDKGGVDTEATVVKVSPVSGDAFNYTTDFTTGAPNNSTYDANAIPTWTDVSSEDTKTTLIVYFYEVPSANLTVTANNSGFLGDTGVLPKLTYTLGAVDDNFKDAVGNSAISVTDKVATDGAAPMLVNGSVFAAGSKFSTIHTLDSKGVTYGSDYLSGDGYIDGFKLYFSEKVKVTKADTVTTSSSWTVNNGSGYSTITIDKGLDTDLDGDVNKNASGDADTVDDTQGALGFFTANLFGTSSKAKAKYDTGRTPTLKYNGGSAIRDMSGNLMAVTGALASYDTAKPVPVVAVGGVNTTQIKVTWSESIYSDNNVSTTWTAVKAGDVYGYDDANVAGNTGFHATDPVTMSGTTIMVLKSSATLTLSDVEVDSIWVKDGTKVFDNADSGVDGGTYLGAAVGTFPALLQNNADYLAGGVGFNIIINDVIAPYITDAITIDANGNGYIDHIKFTFSEPIKIETIDGYTAMNTMSADVAATWQLAGYTGTAKWNFFVNDDTGKEAARVAVKPVFSDAQFNGSGYIFYLELEEDKVPVSVSGLGSTDYAGIFTIGTTTLSDNKPNLLDKNSTESDAMKSGDAVKDRVGPILMAAQTTSRETLLATFSENVRLGSVTWSDFDWTVGTDLPNYDERIAVITQPSPGMIELRVRTEGDAFDADMGGTLATLSDVDDNVVVSTGPTTYNHGIVSGTSPAYGNATWWKLSSGSLASDNSSKNKVASNRAITVGATVLAAPTNFAVSDVEGDNGYVMMATFTPSTSRDVKSYQFYKKSGDNYIFVADITSNLYVNGDGMVMCYVPTPVNGEFTWTVLASGAQASSAMAMAAKEGEILTATLTDAAAKIAVVPASAMSNEAVGGSIDNIAPSALTTYAAGDAAGAGAGIMVSWTAPADHGIVGTRYIGQSAFPIYGVEKYEIYRKTATTDYVLVGSSSGLTTSFVDATVADGATIYQYMIKALDGNVEHTIETGTRSAIAVGALATDFNGNNVVDFADFSIFAANYGMTKASTPESFLTALDLKVDANNTIDFADFSIFAASYGSTAKVAKAAIAGMPTSNVAFGLGADLDEANSTYYVTVNVGQEDILKGFEFFLTYNNDAVEFVDGSITGTVGLTLNEKMEDGVIRVTSGFIGEQFDGSVTMAFRSRGVNASVDFAIINAQVDGTNGIAAATNLASMTYKAKPTVYALSPNYPNPFNPTTTIEYSIPTSGNVELAIYNAAGQKVRTLVSEHQSASFYKAVWDGRNDMGESVGSGIYFYRLVSGNFSKIQKMTLIK